MKRLLIIMLFLVSGLIATSNARGQSSVDSAIDFYLSKINADSIFRYIEKLENFGTRFALAPNRREVAGWIKNKFRSFGYEDVVLDSFQYSRNWSGTVYDTWQYNVVCSFTGSAFPKQVYVMGAHHDSYAGSPANPLLAAPGADDNASGVAATLEVARVLMQYGYQPMSTIKFVTFAAEELGLHGAWNFASKAEAGSMDIRMMVNNDMVAHSGSLAADQWTVQIQKYPNSQWVTDLAKQLIGKHTNLKVVESTRYIQQSDSWAFYRKNFPAIFFIEDNFTPQYHTINDRISTLNKHYTAEMVKISAALLIYENGVGIRTGEQVPEHPKRPGLVDVYPNPFTLGTTFRYVLNKDSNASLRIFNGQMVEVANVFEGRLTAGSGTMTIHRNNLAPGIYLGIFQTENYRQALKLVITD